MRRTALAAAFTLLALPALAGSVTPRPGWEVRPTDIPYAELLDRLKAAVTAEHMIAVAEAGPTEAAAREGETIPGNRVIGVFRNDFALRAIRSSGPAMIEAPIRFYVTEDKSGGATLSWKTPSHVFGPYFDEGGDELETVAEELDAIFLAIADRATEG